MPIGITGTLVKQVTGICFTGSIEKRNQRGIHLNNLADILIIIVCRLTDYSADAAKSHS